MAITGHLCLFASNKDAKISIKCLFNKKRHFYENKFFNNRIGTNCQVPDKT